MIPMMKPSLKSSYLLTVIETSALGVLYNNFARGSAKVSYPSSLIRVTYPASLLTIVAAGCLRN
jgi:hypothetical protein